MRRREFIPALVALAASMASRVATADSADAGSPTLRDAWARPTPPGSAMAAVYLTIVGGATRDRLVGARTTRAAMTQVHAVTRDGGMTRMREANGVPVPAQAEVRLAPEGLHLMLTDLVAPLRAGERFEVTLEFERAGPRTVAVEVLALDAAPPRAH